MHQTQWIRTPDRNPTLGRIVRACKNRRDELYRDHHWVPFPQVSCGFEFQVSEWPGSNAAGTHPDCLHVSHRRVWASLGAKARREILVGSLPVGALLMLWERSPLFQTDCACGGKALGFAFNVLPPSLSNSGGIVYAICPECDRLARWEGPAERFEVDVFPHLRKADIEAVRGPWRKDRGMHRMKRPEGETHASFEPLRDLLERLGEHDLPARYLDRGSAVDCSKSDFHPEQARLLAATLRHREELLALDPYLPIPQTACCFVFGQRRAPFPIGAAFLLWDGHPDLTAPCPCGGRMLGTAFGGLLSVGGVFLRCPTCARGGFRFIGGLSSVRKAIIPFLADTPYPVSGMCFGSAFGSPVLPLLEALRTLGETDLPDEAWAMGESGASTVGLTCKGGGRSLPAFVSEE